MTSPPVNPVHAPVPKPPVAGFFAATGNPKGNNPFSRAVAAEVTDLLRRRSARSARSLQIHLGPSEIGHPCDRQVSAKLAGVVGEPSQFADPWPSIVGTAVHEYLAQAFKEDDPARYLVENRVTPIAGHEGTADLYDAKRFMVADHKNLGASPMAKLQAAGPSLTYLIQLYLYALGYMRAGYQVDQVALIAYPRTGSSLDGIYVWSEEVGAHTVEALEHTFAQLKVRKAYAAELLAGTRTLDSVPATPDACIFCHYRSGCRDAR